MATVISDRERDTTTLEKPSVQENTREEWKEKNYPFKQAGRMFEGTIRCYFHEELQELKGDADEIEIEYTRRWY